jgi:hypothetical protein
MKDEETNNASKKIIPCIMCRQPVVELNRFTVSWSKNGDEINRVLCGSRCLRDWAENYSEDIKLKLYNLE